MSEPSETTEAQRDRLLVGIDDLIEKQNIVFAHFTKLTNKGPWDKWGPTVVGCLVSAFLIAVPSYIAVLRGQAVQQAEIAHLSERMDKQDSRIKDIDDKAGKAIVDAGLASSFVLKRVQEHIERWHKKD